MTSTAYLVVRVHKNGSNDIDIYSEFPLTEMFDTQVSGLVTQESGKDFHTARLNLMQRLKRETPWAYRRISNKMIARGF